MRAFASVVVALALGVGSAAGVVAIQADVSAEILDYELPLHEWGYSPAVIVISPGTWVTWSNAGQEEHTVTAVDWSFDSGILGPSEGFSLYFDHPGTHQYFCVLHEWMLATVEVVAAEDPLWPADDLYQELDVLPVDGPAPAWGEL